ncbi:MAG: type VI secretion system ImpA family N-terminal domain-containing protein [Motiliproteus sp.]
MEHLLTAISEDAPCGDYLKGNRTLYRGLRNNFNLAQSSFRQLVESPDAAANEELLDTNHDNWAELAKQCQEHLTGSSKDVELLCWLATAQLFSSAPLPNLSAVLKVFAEVVDNYWSDLHPKPPEDKLKATNDEERLREWTEFKLRPLLQLVGDSEGTGLLYMPLQMITLVGGIDYSGFYAAERSGSLNELKEQAQSGLASERKAVIETICSLGLILEQLQKIELKIGEYCLQAGISGLSFRFVKQSVERLLNAMRYLLGDQLNPWPLDKTEASEAGASEVGASEVGATGDSIRSVTETSQLQEPATTAAQVDSTSPAEAVLRLAPGEIYNRDQAFQELRKLADFFNRTEPHSPIYMLLERAIRWGYMPLPDLLAEMVGDNDQVMGHITRMAGLESIEKTDIPEVKISSRELQQHSQAAVNTTPAAQPTVNTVEDVAAQNDSSKAADSSVSSFQW